MSNNKRFNFGPVALTTTYTTNILNPPTAAGGTNGGSSSQYILIHRLRIVNKTAVAATVRLYKGATGANAAGTEILFDKSVPANDKIEEYPAGGLRFDAADFLVGGASATLSLVISGEGEIGVAG